MCLAVVVLKLPSVLSGIVVEFGYFRTYLVIGEIVTNSALLSGVLILYTPVTYLKNF